MDFCIVKKDDKGNWYRLIHKKTGYTNSDRYFWNQVPNSSKVSEKAVKLKANIYGKKSDNVISTKRIYI